MFHKILKEICVISLLISEAVCANNGSHTVMKDIIGDYYPGGSGVAFNHNQASAIITLGVRPPNSYRLLGAKNKRECLDVSTSMDGKGLYQGKNERLWWMSNKDSVPWVTVKYLIKNHPQDEQIECARADFDNNKKLEYLCRVNVDNRHSYKIFDADIKNIMSDFCQGDKREKGKCLEHSYSIIKNQLISQSESSTYVWEPAADSLPYMVGGVYTGPIPGGPEMNSLVDVLFIEGRYYINAYAANPGNALGIVFTLIPKRGSPDSLICVFEQNFYFRQ